MGRRCQSWQDPGLQPRGSPAPLSIAELGAGVWRGDAPEAERRFDALGTPWGALCGACCCPAPCPRRPACHPVTPPARCRGLRRCRSRSVGCGGLMDSRRPARSCPCFRRMPLCRSPQQCSCSWRPTVTLLHCSDRFARGLRRRCPRGRRANVG